MGCSEQVSKLLTRLTTYNGSVPQGFPTSSTIANIILASFTPRITTACEKHKVTFTFYQDDLCVSGGNQVKEIPNLFSRILYAGFTVGPFGGMQRGFHMRPVVIVQHLLPGTGGYLESFNIDRITPVFPGHIGPGYNCTCCAVADSAAVKKP